MTHSAGEVKFYDLAEVGVEVGSRVLFRRNPYHVKDKNWVEVHLAGRNGMMLGHMAAEVAKTLSPLLLRHLHISGQVLVAVYYDLGA